MATYRVITGTVYLRDGQERQRAQRGDEFDLEPDRAEPLLAKGQIEPVAQDAESGDSRDAEDETDESPDESEDADTADEGGHDEAEGDEADTEAELDLEKPPETLTTEWVEAAEYRGLQRAAKDYDGVNGNWGADRLRAELLGALENSG